MANYKRGYPRTKSRRKRDNWADKKLPGYDGWRWLNSWPRWWDIMFHTRPWRRESKKLLRDVVSGRKDWDEVSFNSSYHKPHQYYW